MSRTNVRVLMALLVALALPGCQLIVDFDRSRIVEVDGGTDGGAAEDGGAVDGGSDAGTDAGEPEDGGTDAGEPDDGGTDAAVAMTCGNGTVEGTEECDDGNTVTERCDYGTATCTVCSATCEEVAATGPVCGDSMVEAGEETCDDGPLNGTYGSCNADCSGVLECGDGIVSAPDEECEPPGTATCDESCMLR